METAGLTAERGSAPQRRKIASSQSRGGDRTGDARGESAIEDDGAFHRDTAHASGNAQFVRSLEYLGRFIIPRHAIRAESDRLSGQIANMRTFQAEHQRIDAAIQNRDPPRGRCAHICDRYRSLAEVSRKAPVLSPWDSIDND
jgi:DNA-binding FadR family transcriptional regulator